VRLQLGHESLKTFLKFEPLSSYPTDQAATDFPFDHEDWVTLKKWWATRNATQQMLLRMLSNDYWLWCAVMKNKTFTVH